MRNILDKKELSALKRKEPKGFKHFAGIDILAADSTIFESDNIKEAIEKLK